MICDISEDNNKRLTAIHSQPRMFLSISHKMKHDSKMTLRDTSDTFVLVSYGNKFLVLTKKIFAILCAVMRRVTCAVMNGFS